MSPEELKSLSERFQAIAHSDADKQAPAHVEAALLAAFREQSKPRVIEIRRKRTVWVWAVAAAAAVLVIFGATLGSRPKQQEVAVVPTPTPAPVQQIEPSAPPAPLVAKVRPPRPMVAKARPKVAPEALQQKEVTTEFIAVTPGELLAPEETGRVLRVKLPRSALAAFGFPMNVEKYGERIPADLLLGEDGSTRAVRFVQTVSYR